MKKKPTVKKKPAGKRAFSTRAKTAFGVLTHVRKLILADPLRYDQRETLIHKTRNNSYFNFPACNTIGCRAGWVTELIAPNPRKVADPVAYAIRALRLDPSQADILFASYAADGYGQTKEHARSGAEGIFAFQQQYAKQLKATRLPGR